MREEEAVPLPDRLLVFGPALDRIAAIADLLIVAKARPVILARGFQRGILRRRQHVSAVFHGHQSPLLAEFFRFLESPPMRFASHFLHTALCPSAESLSGPNLCKALGSPPKMQSARRQIFMRGCSVKSSTHPSNVPAALCLFGPLTDPAYS